MHERPNSAFGVGNAADNGEGPERHSDAGESSGGRLARLLAPEQQQRRPWASYATRRLALLRGRRELVGTERRAWIDIGTTRQRFIEQMSPARCFATWLRRTRRYEALTRIREEKTRDARMTASELAAPVFSSGQSRQQEARTGKLDGSGRRKSRVLDKLSAAQGLASGSVQRRTGSGSSDRGKASSREGQSNSRVSKRRSSAGSQPSDATL